jgi:hypothetical protein
MDWIIQLYHQVLRGAGNLGPQHWVLILVAIIVIGAYFLRGFGSRAKY